jgi:hypothetical protein
MPDLAAVPSNEHQPYLNVADVTDEEFDAWVKRSQEQTDAVMADWDDSVEFMRVPESIEEAEAEADAQQGIDERAPDPFTPAREVSGASYSRGSGPRTWPIMRFEVHEVREVEVRGASLSLSILDDEVIPDNVRIYPAPIFAWPDPPALSEYDRAQSRQRLEEQGFVVLERSREPFGNAMNFWLPPPDPTIEAVRREYGVV